MMKRWLSLLLALILSSAMLLSGCTDSGLTLSEMLAMVEEFRSEQAPLELQPFGEEDSILEDGHYTSKAEVGLYLYLYGHLPSNFITKKEAQKLGWVSKEGNLWDVAPGMSIGGDKFGNYEGILPEGKKYYECDIDYQGGYRSEKRIVYSTDGYVYYTEDHYESFEQLYP